MTDGMQQSRPYPGDAAGSVMLRAAPSRPARPGEAGFSLIEVLAALVIMSLLLVAGSSVMRLVTSAGERGTRAAERGDMLGRAFAAIRNDLMHIERGIVKRNDKLSFAFSGSARSLSFLAVEPPFPTEPGSYTISYRVEGSDGAVRLVRARSVFDPASDKEGRPDRAKQPALGEAVEVLGGPYRIAFAYFDGTERRWLDAWRAPERLPQLIRLTLAPTAAGVAPVTPLVVRLRVDAETTCAGSTPPCGPRDGRLLPPPRTAVGSSDDAAPTVPTPGRAARP